MLDQLFNIVRQFGKRSVIDNPEVPNQYNENVLADATKTIASGFQNVLAGGGFGNLLGLFNRRGTSQRGIMNNPIVSMMIGYFISKLVGKYKMKPAAASQVANELIPQSVNKLVEDTRDPQNERVTLDNLIASLTGQSSDGNGYADSQLQELVDKDVDPELEEQQDGNGRFNLRDIISNLARKTQDNFADQQESRKPGIMDMIKSLIPN